MSATDGGGEEMKKLVIAVMMVLMAAVSHAGCPKTPAAEQRTRIVKCTDDTYAVQWILEGSWVTLSSCGISYEQAKEVKSRSIEWDNFMDQQDCPPEIRQPIEVVD
jgi:hypothetical protein